MSLDLSNIENALEVLIEAGMMWPVKLRCSECHSDHEVYETHRDLIDASRQVLVCKQCLISLVFRIEDDAD